MKHFVLPLLFGIGLCLVIADTSPAEPVSTKRNRTGELFTQSNVDLAWKQAVALQRPLLVMFTSDSCLYCKKMLTETYGHPAVQQLLSRKTVTVLAHSRDYQALVKKMGIRGFPSSLLVTPDGQVLEFMEGYVDAKKFTSRVAPLLVRSHTPATVASTHTTER